MNFEFKMTWLVLLLPAGKAKTLSPFLNLSINLTPLILINLITLFLNCGLIMPHKLLILIFKTGFFVMLRLV